MRPSLSGFGLLLLGFLLLHEPLIAQTKKPKEQLIAGYQRKVIAGFVVYIHEDVVAKVPAKSEKTVDEVLGLELKSLTQAMPKNIVEVLKQRVPIWVNWHLEEKLNNGRPGAAAGVYTGVHPRPITVEGKQVNVSGIRIFMMDSIMQRYEKTENPPISELLLHEFVHAVHDQIFNYENQPIKEIFRQAMERKLYDKTLYATTNEKEFFAEMSVAFLARLHHYPHDAAELKKHDPATYKLMESNWGKRKEDTKSALKKSEGVPESKFPLTVDWKMLEFGAQVLGAKTDPMNLPGRLYVLHSWRADVGESLGSLQKMQQLHEELGHLGLSIVSGHGYPGKNVIFGGGKMFEAAEVRTPARLRGVTLPVFLSAKSPDMNDVRDLPQVAVFDASGNCLFRGNPFEAETPIRILLNREILEATGIEKFTTPGLPAIVKSLETGTSPSKVIASLQGMVANTSGEPREQALTLLKEILTSANSLVDTAEANIPDNPVLAWQQLEQVTTVFRGSLAAQKAVKLLEKVRPNKLVAAEIRAKPLLEAVRKLDTTLAGKPQSFDPMLPKFRSENAALLKQLKEAIDKVKKAAAGSRAAEEADLIAERYGV